MGAARGVGSDQGLPPSPVVLRARAQDRIRAARSTGLRNLPLHRTAQNRIWLEIVQIALDLLAWMPMLALDRHGQALGAPPTTAPPVLRGRSARRHRSPQDSSPHPALALDRRDHRRPRTARAPAQPRLTSNSPPSRRQHHPIPGSGTRRPPTRQPGRRPAHHQLRKAKGPTDSVGGPSRKIEVREALSMRANATCRLPRTSACPGGGAERRGRPLRQSRTQRSQARTPSGANLFRSHSSQYQNQQLLDFQIGHF